MTIAVEMSSNTGRKAYRSSDTTSSNVKNSIDYSILSEAVLYRLRRAQLSVVHDFNESLVEFGLRPADFAVLVLVANNSGLKQSDVAEALGIQRANFVAIIDGLEDKGLLQRRKSDTDRRVHYLDLTKEGSAAIEVLSNVWRSHEGKLIDRLGGQDARDQLIGLLRRIQD